MTAGLLYYSVNTVAMTNIPNFEFKVIAGDECDWHTCICGTAKTKETNKCMAAPNKCYQNYTIPHLNHSKTEQNFGITQ